MSSEVSTTLEKGKNHGAKGYYGKGAALNILQMTIYAVYGFTGHMHGIIVKVKAII